MNERQLESFLAIVNHGSFASAADRLCLTQSAVSARIKELEDDLGVELFDRAQKKVQLTTKGRELIEYAEQVNVLFKEIKSRVGADGAMSGVVRIGTVELVAITWMHTLVSALNKEYPAVTFEFEGGLRPVLLEGLRSGKLDLVIVAGELSMEARKSLGLKLASAHLGTAAFAWMASANLDVGDDVLLAKDLRKLPVVYQGAESLSNGIMNKWLLRSNPRRQHGTSANFFSSIVALVEAGVGICLLPISACAPWLNEKKLKILRTDPPAMNIPYFVLYAQHGRNDLFARVAELSVQSSTFDRQIQT
jgi:DNA-binding transcriptional LysR family regulator